MLFIYFIKLVGVFQVAIKLEQCFLLFLFCFTYKCNIKKAMITNNITLFLCDSSIIIYKEMLINIHPPPHPPTLLV